MRKFAAVGAAALLMLGLVTFAATSTNVVAQEYGRDFAEDDLYGGDRYDDELYEGPYADDYEDFGYDEDYNYELYDEPYDDIYEDDRYDDGYTGLYDWYDWDRDWGAEETGWWEDHPFYNEDEWYDPSDWFDGNNYEFDEDAYEAYLRDQGYDIDEEEGVYEY